MDGWLVVACEMRMDWEKSRKSDVAAPAPRTKIGACAISASRLFRVQAWG